MSEFLDYLSELLHDFGEVTYRRMFGGHGVYRDGVMFALIADDMLYLKADAESEVLYREHELEQFQYLKNTRLVAMSYFQAPDEAMEDAEVMRQWAQTALESAKRARR